MLVAPFGALHSLPVVRLYPTPPERLVDQAGRPYFLWDSDLTLADFVRRLAESPPDGRAYLVGKLMRQARPDDVFTFVGVDEIVALWPRLLRYLGKQRPFWSWLLRYWGYPVDAA
ncbi:MAG: hypothetical protein FJ265_00770 [Planctomycetes bacterium]|nr:hypothetical protein [Planctomycetota bacterium]